MRLCLAHTDPGDPTSVTRPVRIVGPAGSLQDNKRIAASPSCYLARVGPASCRVSDFDTGSARLADLPRPGATCDECGVARAWYVHFTHPDGEAGDGRAVAIVALCRRCHKRRVATADRTRDDAD